MPNPLPDCPSSPNCVKQSFQFSVEAGLLLLKTEAALTKRGASQVTKIDGGIDAIFTIPIFGWKDDVNVRIEPVDTTTSTLHIRSASREGYWDIGVNSRRVRKILRTIERELKN